MAGLLGACSASMEAEKKIGVPKDTLSQTVKERLEGQVGAQADSVECEGDLPAEVGATQRCVLTDGSAKYGVTVTANSVDGDNVKFGVEVDDEPMS
ncbi:hypothetical protein AFA91_07305 [Mycolicibacterium goodii]|uniref:DUF4333 domain-containing protein n=2 Tax=Mycolicibacterium goodii TaxID=134601 RepID=A0A0K0X343_MYCGD|nr:hypothetical protein AFA91_07305 [Mycolicibacterium goodii]